MDLLDDTLQLFAIGGPVMLPIGLLSAWMWIMIALKVDWIWRVRRRSLPLDTALACLRAGKAPSEDACPKARALSLFLGEDTKACGATRQIAFEVAVRRQLRSLYRHIPAILILAAAAPLLGLLGTVSGMIKTFHVIGVYGMGNAQALAAGIKEAMLTTQAGLLVAIPGLIAGQIMRRKVRGIHQDLLVFHRAVTQVLEKEAQPCID